MRRGLTIFVLAALAAAGLAAGMFTSGSAATTTATKPKPKLVTSKVTVVASEFKFVFSKRTVPAGTVIFTVVNKGKIAHNFFIAGKVTPMLLPGKSAKLTVKLTKKGHYAYLCTIVGHAAAGMRGTFSVGVKAVPPPPVTTTTTTTQTTTTTVPTGTVGTASTTVHVSMFEYGFTLDKSSVPSGQVTFVISNDGKEVHNFDVESIKAGAYLNPGQTETWTVALAPRTYAYECDVAFHAQQGMIGNLTVTP